jgi:hypothetical protein
MTDPNNAPDVLLDDSGDPIALGPQIDDGVYIVNEWVQQQAVPVAGLLARATNYANGTLSEFLLSDHAAVIPPLRLFAPLLTGPNAGTFATRTLTRVPGNYATDNLSPEKAQELLLRELNRWTPRRLHRYRWRMRSAFSNNLTGLPNDDLAAATTRELWEISVGGIKRAVVYSWGRIDPNGTPVWFRDYCFSTKDGADARVKLPLKLLPGTNIAISAVSSFQSEQILDLASAKIDAASRLQVDPKDLGLGRLASTSIVPLPPIDGNTDW